LPGSVLLALPGSKFEFFTTPFVKRLDTAPLIDTVGFMGGMQSLDGFRWHGAVFVNSLIRYHGGELELSNTRFINCTFDFADSSRSPRVATYVTLNQSYLKIGPNN
jgi:hypothetical protein